VLVHELKGRRVSEQWLKPLRSACFISPNERI
jgi:hypothetical protein